MKAGAAVRTTGTRRKYVGLLFISPWILGFLIFQLYPFVASFVFSFTDLSILKKPTFIGLANYLRMFTRDELFYKSLRVTFVYALVAVPAKIVFALLVAVMLNVRLRLVNFYRTIFYLPSILGGSVAISILWRFMFGTFGFINALLSSVSLPGVNWLGNPDIALFTLSLLAVWQFGSSRSTR